MKASRLITMILAALAFAGLLALAGCGGSAASEGVDEPTPVETPKSEAVLDAVSADEAPAATEDAPYAGVWELSGFIDENGDEMSIEDYASENNVNPSKLLISYEIMADGTALVDNKQTGAVAATWREDGHQIIVTANATDYALEVSKEDGGTVLLSTDADTGVVSIFSKVS